MNSDENYRSELLGHLADAIKQVQMEQMSKEDPFGVRQVESYIANDSPSGRILLSCLEMIFTHGLKNKSNGIWEVMKYFCRSDVVRRIQSLQHVFTNVGKGRAWIYLVLNEKELESYLQSFQMDSSHMSKYYHRFAMICSSQVSVMQTLVSGLDFVNFKLGLDFAYLDFSIKCNKDWPNSMSMNSKRTEERSSDRGSVVHIDAQSITRTGQKAVGFVKEILSHESKMPEKSIDTVNTNFLVAVNSNQAPVRAKKYCQDCHSFYELVCLCEKDHKEVSSHHVQSMNAKILEDMFGRTESQDSHQSSLCSDAASSSASTFFPRQRVNPFNHDADDEPKSVFKRFNQEFPVVDVPVEVRHKKTRRKKRLSETGSDISVRSDDALHRKKNNKLNSNKSLPRTLASSDNLCLSDPLIGFDPQINTVTDIISDNIPSSSSVDASTVDAGHTTELITHGTNSVTYMTDYATYGDGGVNEKCNKQLTQTNKTDSVVISSQDSIRTGSLIVEFSSRGDRGYHLTPVDFKDYSIKMDVAESIQESVDTTLDGNKNNMKMKSAIESNVKYDSVDRKEKESGSVPKEIEHNKPSQNTERDENRSFPKRLDLAQTDDSACDNSLNGSFDENVQDEGDGASESDSVSNVEISSASLETDSKISASFSHSESRKIDSEKLNKSDSRRPSELSIHEKRSIRKSKGMRRYRSESEQLLNALTQKEVERLRAEIQMKLKPSQDRLEKSRKSIEEKNLLRDKCGSLPPESSFTMERTHSRTTSSGSRRLFEDSSDDGTERDSVSSISQDTDPGPLSRHLGSRSSSSISSSSLSSTLLSSRVSHPLNTDPPENHKAVANIDNTLKLYLMLEILLDESEEILKLFHVSTGHSEGNWMALYLLFSDSFLYFLRSGDGNCPYCTEHTVSYEDLDYTSVGYNNQTIEFAFYTYKIKSMSKGGKGFRGKVRTKVVIDTGEKHLTDLIITVLSKAIVSFMRRQSVLIKVCPPVFHDAREHQISLIKYLRQEGMTGDIQLYQLVHWEDPDFINGTNMTKVSLEGTLKYKTQSFWGSSWKSAYFVLSGGVLYQYQKANREKPELSYDLTGNNCVGCKRIRSSSSANPSLEFEVNFRDESKLELCGYSDVEVTDWLQCLCMIVSLDQSSIVDKGAATDGMVINMLNHDALVPCGLILADETLLLCHEDQHTGFCRTLAKARRQDITAINIDKEKSFVCEIIVENSSGNQKKSKWGIFFPNRNPIDLFLGVLKSFSKCPALSDNSDDSTLTHYLEARTLLDNRWSRTDNLLKGRGGSSENYTFIE